MSLVDSLRRLGVPSDEDYVAGFEVFVEECQNTFMGDVTPRLRRAEAAYRIGDYYTALHDARWCVLQVPNSLTANRLLGTSALAVAAAQLTDLPPGPGLPPRVTEPPDMLVSEASNAFQRALRLHEGDQQASLGLHAIHELSRLHGGITQMV